MDEPLDVSPSKSSNEQRLGFWDAVSIIVGIVVGTAIFKSPTLVFQNVLGPWQGMGAWLLGGLLTFCGALCYAELTTAYPQNGGDYEYLTRVFGRGVGFLFGWAQLTVVLSGSIGIMAYAFADYGVRLLGLGEAAVAGLATAAVLAMTVLNVLGMVVGKTAQNVLSAAKIAGLLALVAAGIARLMTGPHAPAAPPKAMDASFGLAMVFVLYAFGGWNDSAFVAAEVRDPQRNMPRALIAGITAITLIYLAVNATFLAVLGFDSARASMVPAADVLERAVGSWGGRAISALVMISALGAINGMILTGSRVYARLGDDHRVLAWLGSGSRANGSPVAALVAQAAVTVALILAVGTSAGQRAIDRVLTSVSLPGLPWGQYFGGFETLVAGTAPVFWAFFLLTGISLFVLRFTDRKRSRPFAVPLFPVPPLIFCAMCVYMLYSSLAYARLLALLGLVPFALGVPLYLVSQVLSGRGK
jgi:amino acid transporter